MFQAARTRQDPSSDPRWLRNHTHNFGWVRVVLEQDREPFYENVSVQLQSDLFLHK